jgi:hypothetical protein
MKGGFPASARKSLADDQLRRNIGKATTTIRAKRERAVSELPDWQALRDAGAAIKARAMATLPEQLERLEASVIRAGGTVHWARDGAEANTIVARIAREHGSDEVIKVKSLAADEIGMNEALAAEGIRAIETDLAELIVQLAYDKQSHILVPAIHKNRAEIRALFEGTIAQGQDLGLEASAIAEAARELLVIDVGVAARAGRQLGPLDRQHRNAGQAAARAQRQHLTEQAGQRVLVALNEPRDRGVIGPLLRRQHPERHVLLAGPLDHPRGPDPARVGVKQDGDHHRRVIGRPAAPVLAVDGVEPVEFISATASITNHARWLSGSQSRTSGGIRNGCSRSHATNRGPIGKWS